MSLNTALARMERALSKNEPKPVPEERHPVFPADETGFQELVRKLRLENLTLDAQVCRQCGEPRGKHVATVPTALQPGLQLVCPLAPTFEWDGVEAKLDEPGAPS